MTAYSQDFTIYAGRASAPVFTITDGAGNALDVSGMAEIEWIMYRDVSLTAVITKKKSLGGLSFVNTGVDGLVRLNLANADSTGTDGWYFHGVQLTDATGAANKTIVEQGRVAVLQAGPM